MNKLEEYEALVDTTDAHAVMGSDKWKLLPAATVAPRFEPEWLPVPLREMAQAVVDSLGVPFDMPAVFGLGASSACATGKVEVRTSTITQPIQLYVMCAAPSGTKKTPTFNYMLSYPQEWQDEKNRAMRDALGDAKAEHEWLKEAYNRAVKKEGGTSQKAIEASRALRRFEESMPRKCRLFCPGGNVTPERFVEMTKENKGNVVLLDDEGQIFDILKGQYSDNPAIEPFLKAYDGGSLHLGRRTGDIDVDRGNAAIIAATQTGELEEILKTRRFVTKGLLPRFLITCPAAARQYKRLQPLPNSVVKEYEGALRRILELPDGIKVTVKPEAFEMYEAWREKCVDMLLDEWKVLAATDFPGKFDGQTLRIAANLLLWDEHSGWEIGAATMSNAIEIMRYFALQVLHLLNANSGVNISLTPQAEEALKRIQGGKYENERLLKKALDGLTLFKRVNAESALDQLEGAGLIKRVKQGGVGRHTTTIELHPDLRPRKDEARI